MWEGDFAMQQNKNFKMRYGEKAKKMVSLFAAGVLTAIYCGMPPVVRADGYITQTVTVTADRAPLRIGGGEMFLIADYARKGERFEALGHYVDAAGRVWLETERGGRRLWVAKSCCDISNTLGEIPEKDFSRENPPKIYLSPSRQPYNPYAVGSTNEMEQMEALAAELAHVLRGEYGCEVYIAPSYMRISAGGRPSDAAAKGCDIYLALHSNAAPDGGKRAGAEAYYYAASAQSRQLAESIVRELDAASEIPAQGAAGAVSAMEYFDNFGYGEVRDPSNLGLIAVLAEVDYHDNPDTARRIIENKQEIAQALARAVGALMDITNSPED